MAQGKASRKRVQITKANSSVVVTVAISAFIVIFTLVASRSLWQKMSFQNRVISEKEVARNQLRENLNSIEDLVVAYKVFVETPDNVIGGLSGGKGDNDGDNAKIILDALPSKYDFPGLTTSLEKVMKDNGNNIIGISGTDEEVSQSAPGGATAPVEMPFELTAGGNLDSISKLLGLLDRSIRPIQVKQLKLSGTNSDLNLTITAKSFYQPGRSLEITTKVVK